MKKKNGILALGAVVLLIAIFAFAYQTFAPETQKGSKNITIEVVNSKEESTVYTLSTDAEFLRQAMDEAEGLEYTGEEGQYGLMILEVNGEKAVYEENKAYWALYLNGEYCNYSADQQPINDKDAFQIVYTIG